MEKENKNEIEKQKNKEISAAGLVSIDIKSIFRILGRNKLWFIITFIVIFCVFFSFTYFVTPDSRYSANSSFAISTENIRYQEKLNYYFPKEAYDLWLIANEQLPLNSINYYYMDAINDIYSDRVIDDASGKLGGVISKEIIRQSVIAEKSLDSNYLNITISYKNSTDTKKISEAVLDSFLEIKNNDFQATYDDLLAKIESKISELNKTVDSLMEQADEYSIQFNKKIISELKNEKNKEINFYLTGYIPPNIKIKLDSANETVSNLTDIKNNMIEYKDLYLNRMALNVNPSVISNINILKNLILSFAAGLVFGLIFAFAANYFKSN
ncbi:MAG TPA: hypothetical protein VMZ91_05620 [Candidatus Paceibacterota bacterium]|nr:hypothetical protein [Candidatus Paceibacterota bacterium]